MRKSASDVVQDTLRRADVHDQWIRDFYTEESQSLYDMAFDDIAAALALHEKSPVLDAGCGDGTHTIRLARRGYPVVALDFSEYVLDRARSNVLASGLAEMVKFEHGSLINLPFTDSSFDFVLCWGVLTHIPEVEKAVAELARVVKPNGFLIISESNMWSLEAVLVRIVRRVLATAGIRGRKGKPFAALNIGVEGAAYWRQTDAGPLICREMRFSWLIRKLAACGFALKERRALQFTERHVALRGKLLKRWVNKFNLAWFRYVRLPTPAANNLLIFVRGGVQ
jgi:2-polyprenyl-3-methyl-5-hydroxy-6-metoxy-1,4-benzoquinol methylase